MKIAAIWLTVAAAAAFVGSAHAQSLEPANRQELKRAPLTGTKMEVIVSMTEYKPGDVIQRHIHHGEEATYVLQGATVETPDGKKLELKTGTGSVTARELPHAGIKVVGDTALKLVTVHIVDKGSTLYDAPPK